jgi:IS30 family transposase
MIDIFAGIPAQSVCLLRKHRLRRPPFLAVRYVLSITPDRGVEFMRHADVTAVFEGFEFYFADPHSPWQRGTNENTNGLLREYFPKSFDFDSCSDEYIRLCVDRINLRPRKCLGWLSPFEVFFWVVLHLV